MSTVETPRPEFELDPSVVAAEIAAVRQAETPDFEQYVRDKARANVMILAEQDLDLYNKGIGGKYDGDGGIGTDLLPRDEDGRELAVNNGPRITSDPNNNGSTLWSYRSVTDKDPIVKLVTQQGEVAAFKAVRGEEFESPAQTLYSNLKLRDLVKEYNSARTPQTVEVTTHGGKSETRTLAPDVTKADDILDVLAAKVAALPEDSIVSTIEMLNQGHKGAKKSRNHKQNGGKADLSGFEGMKLDDQQLHDLLGRVITAREHNEIRTERAAALGNDSPVNPVPTPEPLPTRVATHTRAAVGPKIVTSEAEPIAPVEPIDPEPVLLVDEAAEGSATIIDGARTDVDDSGVTFPEPIPFNPGSSQPEAEDHEEPVAGDQGAADPALTDAEEQGLAEVRERLRRSAMAVPKAPEPLDLGGDDGEAEAGTDINGEPQWRDDGEDEWDVPSFLRPAHQPEPAADVYPEGWLTTLAPSGPETIATPAARSEIEPAPVEFVVGFAEQALHGQDTLLVAKDIGTFGVFDGMGSGENPKLASGTAADALERKLREMPAPQSVDEAKEQMRTAFDFANDAVVATGVWNNITTAVAARIVRFDGKNYAIFGNAGDSRSFVSHVDGSFDSVTTDQSIGRVIGNGMGINKQGGLVYGADPDSPVEVYAVEMEAGDRVMLASDGITGDTKEQFLSDSAIGYAFSEPTPQKSAETFIEISKKEDDKTVVVIDIAGETRATNLDAAPAIEPASSDVLAAENTAEVPEQPWRKYGPLARLLGSLGILGGNSLAPRVEVPRAPGAGPRPTPRPRPAAARVVEAADTVVAPVPAATPEAEAPRAATVSTPLPRLREIPRPDAAEATRPVPGTPNVVRRVVVSRPDPAGAETGTAETTVAAEVVDPRLARLDELRQEVVQGIKDRSAVRGSAMFIERNQEVMAILKEVDPEGYQAAYQAYLQQVAEDLRTEES